MEKLESESFIKEAIEKETEKIYEEYKVKMIEKLDIRKREVIAGIVIAISKEIDVQNAGERTIISIKELKEK